MFSQHAGWWEVWSLLVQEKRGLEWGFSDPFLLLKFIFVVSCWRGLHF